MRKVVFIIPIFIWVILCVAEWWLWLMPPYNYFYTRGISKPNISYQAITVGDLVPGNIFVTPVPRLCLYVTDRNGTRNSSLPKEADIIIFGDSFAWGAGNSHEDTPAVQLSRITGKKVVLTSGNLALKAVSGLQQAAFLIKYNQPVPGKVFLYFILDGDLLEPTPWVSDPSIDIKNIFQSEQSLPSYTLYEKFSNFKQYLKDYSPQAIIARKLKTGIETTTFSFLYRHKVFGRQSKSLDYLDHNGKVYGFMKTRSQIGQFSSNNIRLIQTVRGFKILKEEAEKLGITFIPVIIPRKQIVYHKYISDGFKIEGYGPGQILYDSLKKENIDAVFLHPPFFKAVREEIEKGKTPVYWSDDTHRSPYGIAIASQTIKDFLKQKGLL